MNKKRSKHNKKLGKIVDCTVYTEESFFLCYPDANEEDYYEYLGNSEYLLIKNLEKEMGYSVKALKRVILDEEYFEWLKRNGLKEEQKQRFVYMSKISTNEAERIWLKHNRPNYSNISVLPIMFSSERNLPNNNYVLPKGFLKEMKASLSQYYKLPSKYIFINEELLRGDCCSEEFIDDVFEVRAERYFIDNKIEFQKQPFLSLQQNSNLNIRFLPVALWLEDKALLSKERAKWEENLDNDLPIETVEKLRKKLNIEMKFDGNLWINNSFILSFEIEDFLNSLKKELQIINN